MFNSSTLRWTAIFVALLAFLTLFVPVSTGLAIGGDDGFELTKASLLSRTPSQATVMWNDQPWLHTMTVGFLFRTMGETAAIPRVISLLSTLTILVALAMLFQHAGYTGWPVGCGAALFLTSDSVPYLMFSAMVELPALALAFLAAVWVFSADKSRGGTRSALSSGFVFACALHVKLTALLLLPSVFIGMLLPKTTSRTRYAVLWVAAFTTCFTSIAYLSPAWNLAQILGTHFYANVSARQHDAVAMGPQWGYFLSCPALLVAALLGMWHCARRRMELMAFVGAFLVSGVIFAAVQRPWWRFYMVYIGTPLALFGGVGLGRWIQGLRPRPREAWATLIETGNARGSGIPEGHGLVALVLALWLCVTLPVVRHQFTYASAAQVAFEDRFLKALRNYTTPDRWCYTSRNEYAFHSGALIPPELIVLSRKRMLAEGLEAEKILAIAKQYSPAWLLLRKNFELENEKWIRWAQEGFGLVAEDSEMQLWVANQFNPEVVQKFDPRFQMLGL